jgi:hypothetical protein
VRAATPGPSGDGGVLERSSITPWACPSEGSPTLARATVARTSR